MVPRLRVDGWKAGFGQLCSLSLALMKSVGTIAPMDATAPAITPRNGGDEGQPIRSGHPQAPRRRPLQNVHLMAENQILSFEMASRLQQGRQPTQKQI